MIHKVQNEVESEYDGLKKKLSKIKSALSWRPELNKSSITDSGDMLDDIGADIAMSRDALRLSENSEEIEVTADRDLAVGDPVAVRGSNTPGVVRSISDTDGQVEILVGNVVLRVSEDLLITIDSSQGDKRQLNIGYNFGPTILSEELDVRGMSVADALTTTEDFLDKAFRDGLTSVRIIHGKGTGALRKSIRTLFEHHPLVDHFAPEMTDKGGEGVTVVELNL
jgi:DNA mismatch repair protein MutS2